MIDGTFKVGRYPIQMYFLITYRRLFISKIIISDKNVNQLSQLLKFDIYLCIQNDTVKSVKTFTK